jgi:aminoglycoside 6'-N-acetyltransferase
MTGKCGGMREDPDVNISFRPLERADLPELAGWLADPAVRRWWTSPSNLAGLEAKYGPRIDGSDPVQVFVIQVDTVSCGIFQRYPAVRNDDWKQLVASALPGRRTDDLMGIDYLLGPPQMRGRGVGTAALLEFVALLFEELPQTNAVLAMVRQENRPSCRALLRAGFDQIWSGTVAGNPHAGNQVHLLMRTREGSGTAPEEIRGCRG